MSVYICFPFCYALMDLFVWIFNLSLCVHFQIVASLYMYSVYYIFEFSFVWECVFFFVCGMMLECGLFNAHVATSSHRTARYISINARLFCFARSFSCVEQNNI